MIVLSGVIPLYLSLGSLVGLVILLGVACFNHAQAMKGLPIPQIAIEPMQLTSFALSLLLVFRTNASYSR